MQDEYTTRAILDHEFGHYVWPQTYHEYLRVGKVDNYYSESDRWRHFYRPMLDVLLGLHLWDTERGSLEVGPRRFPLTHFTDRMDLRDYGVPQTVRHDAGTAPWPFADRQYSVVIMSHVLEHLGANQSQAVREASRVGDVLLIAIPYRWTGYEQSHQGLGEDTLATWLAGVPGTLEGAWVTGKPQWRQLLWLWRVR